MNIILRLVNFSLAASSGRLSNRPILYGIYENTVSLKVPPTHWPYHRQNGSVMCSVSDGRWVGVVEGSYCRDDWLRVGRVMSMEHNYAVIDGENEGGDRIYLISPMTTVPLSTQTLAYDDGH